MSKSCPLCGTAFPDSAVFCQHDGTSLRAIVENDDLIGMTLCDRYVVTECLGQGGMGAVYLARDVRLPQHVAVKVLRQRTASDPAMVARFRQEAEAASRINHDRVARVFDFGFMEDGRAYLVMEFVDGRTLKDLIEDGPLHAIDVANISTMIAEGLNAAHRLGILHRDLKPENVMILDDTNGGMRVKVLDFGIAKVIGATDEELQTEQGAMIGTPLWMSPEQLTAETLDVRSDVYALGLLAFVMLTGERAFSGDTREVEMMAPLSAPPRTLPQVMPDVTWPPPLLSLFERTLSRNRNERPASALEFATEMSRAVSGAARPPATVVKLNRNRAPSRTWLVGGAGVVAVLAIGAVVVRNLENTKPDGLTSAGALADSAALRDSAFRATSTATTTADTTPATVPATVPATTAATRRASAPYSATLSTPAANSTAPRDSGTTVPAATSSAAATIAPDVATLRRLMSEADASFSASLSDEAKSARATKLLRDLDALKLTAPLDQGWAQLYKGMAHVTLDEKSLACAAFDRADKIGAGSRALTQTVEQWLLTLGCPPEQPF